MDNQSRLTFLTQYYYELQGVRFAPLWVAGLVLGLVQMPHDVQPSGCGWGAAWSALGALLAIQVLWYWVANEYYRRRYGWLKPDPFRFVDRRPTERVWSIFILSSLALVIFCRLNHWGSFFPYFVALLMCQPVLNPENPLIRRINYGTGGGLVAASALISTFAHLDGAIYFVTLCGVMLALSLADHLLLISLMTPPREDDDA